MKQLIFVLLLLIYIEAGAQLTKPDIFLSQIEMTPSGGQPYDNFYWLNSNNAGLSKSVVFPSSGTYRIDVSVKDVIASPNLAVKIDGVIVGNISISTSFTTNGSPITIYSTLTSSISSGSHSLNITLTNFNYPNNYLKVGLIYATRTSSALPDTFAIPSSFRTFSPGSTLVIKSDFMSQHLRGFSLGGNGCNGTSSSQHMIDMVATGANIARCFVELTRATGSNTYTLKAGEQAKLDSTINRGARLHFYVVPCLYLDPATQQGNADLWGPTSLGANQGIADSFVQRRNSVAILWKSLATKYNNNPAVAAYDLWNEPRSLFNYALYIRWQQQITDSIHTVDTHHVIAIECLDNDMFAMMLPLPDTGFIYSPHGYSTLLITHQGVPGESEANIRNDYPHLTVSGNLAIWTKTELSKQHDNVRIMTHRFHVPVMIGEFSCVNWSPLNSNSEWTSTKWIDDNISLLEAEHWSWCYHNWRVEYIGWEPEIPSQWYVDHATFSNAAPNVFPSESTVRSSTAPTIVMLKGYFTLNSGGTIIRYYKDADGDGYGDINNTKDSTAQPNGYVTNSTDCNDGNANINPGAIETCNGIDDNCNKIIDENVKLTFYKDGDGDGYGNPSVTTLACSPPDNSWVSNNTDCDDTNPNINPGHAEICGNNIDDNCNGQTDEGCGTTPNMAIADTSVFESARVVRIRVYLNQVSSVDVKVNYHCVNNTATAPSDYKATKGTLTIPAGTLSGLISVTIVYDQTVEGDETFFVKLNNPINTTITDNSATITIHNSQ